jgi:mannose-6-phosphate isomerase-like protein (cupin superfamily)
MFVRKFKELNEFTAGDHSILREYFNPLKEKMELNYSLAHAKVVVGKTSTKHKLKSSEVYFILKGKGIMFIDKEQKEVEEKDVICIPPNSMQWIKNTGKTDLEILCIVEPAWKKEDEEVLGKD